MGIRFKTLVGALMGGFLDPTMIRVLMHCHTMPHLSGREGDIEPKLDRSHGPTVS
jgi:hypothetical protein